MEFKGLGSNSNFQPSLTKADEAQRLPTGAGCPRVHLVDMFHALHQRAFPQHLAEPCVPSVQVEDVAVDGLSHLFYGWGQDVSQGNLGQP